jgi:hypothetical protein
MLFYVQNWPQGRRDEDEDGPSWWSAGTGATVAPPSPFIKVGFEDKHALFLMDEMLAGRDPWDEYRQPDVGARRERLLAIAALARAAHGVDK